MRGMFKVIRFGRLMVTPSARERHCTVGLGLLLTTPFNTNLTISCHCLTR